MAIKSKRLRFEILKRDNFTCRYCGATPLDRPLHVDHVVPESKGGTDDPANLIAACKDCNGGKSNIPLEERRLKDPDSPAELKEHAEQIREYLGAQKEILAAKDEALEIALERWRECMGDPLVRWLGHIRRAIKDLGLERTLEAIDATGRRGLSTEQKQIKYFCGVVRNWRAGSQGNQPAERTYGPEDLTVARNEVLAASAQHYWEYRISPTPPDFRPWIPKLLKAGSSIGLIGFYRIIDFVAWTGEDIDLLLSQVALMAPELPKRITDYTRDEVEP